MNGTAGAAIEELLVDLKNTTELMVDLAYSAILYSHRELAEEVLELEEKVDVAHFALIEMAVQSVARGGSAEAVTAVVLLATNMEVIADSAADLASVVLNGADVHPVVRMGLEDADTGIAMVRVSPRSVLAGRALGDLRLSSETGMRVIAIKRERRWTYGPDGSDGIEAGDLLFAVGPQESCDAFTLIAAGRKGID